MVDIDVAMNAKKEAFNAIQDFKDFYDAVADFVKKDKTNSKILKYVYNAKTPAKGLTGVEQVMLSEFAGLVSYYNGWHVKIEIDDHDKPMSANICISGHTLRSGPTTDDEFRKQFNVFDVTKQFNFTVHSGR